jgi:rRNA maturation protein Rpf1
MENRDEVYFGYTIVARGKHLVHKINGQITSEWIDHDERKRASEGLVAIQLHRGNPNSVHIKDLRIKVIHDGRLIPFEANSLSADAKKIDKPRTSNPQGIGPVVPKQ